jgi:hypothetical protein
MYKVEIEYRLGRADYRDAAQKVRRWIGVAPARRAAQAVLAALGAWLVWIYANSGGAENLVYAVVFLGFALLDAVGFTHRGIEALMYRRTDKYRQNQKVSFSDAGLAYTLQDVKSEIAWTYYAWFTETPRTFVLYRDKLQWSVFPKSAFGAEGLATVAALLREKLPERINPSRPGRH